jgi:hypothetical protein
MHELEAIFSLGVPTSSDLYKALEDFISKFDFDAFIRNNVPGVSDVAAVGTHALVQLSPFESR